MTTATITAESLQAHIEQIAVELREAEISLRDATRVERLTREYRDTLQARLKHWNTALASFKLAGVQP